MFSNYIVLLHYWPQAKDKSAYREVLNQNSTQATDIAD